MFCLQLRRGGRLLLLFWDMGLESTHAKAVCNRFPDGSQAISHHFRWRHLL
jgi:hypothetical protein